MAGNHDIRPATLGGGEPMKLVAMILALVLHACSAPSQADEAGAKCESVYVGDGERVKVCQMPDGAKCYMYEGQGISCFP